MPLSLSVGGPSILELNVPNTPCPVKVSDVPDPAPVVASEIFIVVPSILMTFVPVAIFVPVMSCPTSIPDADATVICVPPLENVPVVEAEDAVSLSAIVPRYLSSKLSNAPAARRAEAAAELAEVWLLDSEVEAAEALDAAAVAELAAAVADVALAVALVALALADVADAVAEVSIKSFVALAEGTVSWLDDTLDRSVSNTPLFRLSTSRLDTVLLSASMVLLVSVFDVAAR